MKVLSGIIGSIVLLLTKQTEGSAIPKIADTPG
jgi:hypothetical protein